MLLRVYCCSINNWNSTHIYIRIYTRIYTQNTWMMSVTQHVYMAQQQWGKVKCTLVQALRLCTDHTAHRYSSNLSWPTALEKGGGVMGQCHAPAALYARERPGTHCTVGWVGSWAVLDRCGKPLFPPGFDPRTAQPVASRYTDCAIRPTEQKYICYIFLFVVS
jgi:hypothetical protein